MANISKKVLSNARVAVGEGAPLFLNVQNSKRDRSPDVVSVGDEWLGGVG